jgi:hypothetical protein
MSDARLNRFREAYLQMAKEARYRPKALGDGCGNVSLTATEAADPERLQREARAYAATFDGEEDERRFFIGCSDFRTNRAFVYTIEAARALAAAESDLAIKLLTMAIQEIKHAQSVEAA